jgi:predicted outer membrane repeat protein
MKIRIFSVMLLLVGLVFALTQAVSVKAGPICRVDINSTAATPNGSTWSLAYSNLQVALADLSCVEIWVAAGTYMPGTSQTDTFQMESGVAIIGGFAGTETNLGERDWEANPTILSGDIGGIDDASDNSYHVVTADLVDTTGVLDGFTITKGNANEPTIIFDQGGGLYLNGGNPTLTNLIFTDNSALFEGGGMYIINSEAVLSNVSFINNQTAESGGGIFNDGGDPTLDNIKFIDNYAFKSGGGMSSDGGNPIFNKVSFNENWANGYGGGLYNVGGIAALTDVTFNGNNASGGIAGNSGGGMYNNNSNSNLINVTFIGNTTDGFGGGMTTESSIPTLTNVIFSGNTSNGSGGGIYNYSCSPNLTNVTFSANKAVYFGGGMYNDGGSSPILINSILWGNEVDNFPNQIQNGGSSSIPTISYSDIQGSGGSGAWDSNLGTDGGGNIDVNPFFMDPDGIDGIFGTSDDNLRLSPLSLAIDAGDPNNCPKTDLDSAVRPVDGDGNGTPICDMGAYEAQQQLENVSWERAFQLNMQDQGDAYWAEVNNHLISELGQSRWYKFQVQPGGRVVVKLSDLPANYDLTLYKDIQSTFDTLIDPQNLDDLAKLTAEFAPDAYAPDAYAPDAYAPDAYAPDAYAPDAYAPDAYAPDAYAPDAYAPDAYAPDAYAPDAYAPDAYAPDAYAPDAYAPDAYAPDAYAPDKAYTSAQTRSLVGVSAADGTAGELIAVNTWDNTGDFYIRVKGRNGAFNPSVPFYLDVTQLKGGCLNLNMNSPGHTILPVANGYQTIILTDFSRMNLTMPEASTLQSRLDSLATKSEVNGVVVDVGIDAKVIHFNAEADKPENQQCPFAKNMVARSIKEIITSYRVAGNPLEYVVLIGNDHVIPFPRIPDRAQLANEKNFEPPVKHNTTSYASLNLGYVLSQDFYGSTIDLSLSNTILPLPHLAVGRLVEGYSDIIRMLDAYEVSVDGIIEPTTALVTGYDFLEDAANAIKVELDAGIGGMSDALIADRNISPLDPAAWTAEDLRAELLGNRHDVIFLAGHFSANTALAADYQTQLLSSEVPGSAVNLENSLIFSAGCHAGYNIVNQHGIPNLTLEPDWAQAFAQKGATLIAGTGYQYGDTDFLEYSERLYLYLSKELRAGSGPVPIGKALVRAKQDYLATTPELRGIHEKALLEATLFGLPMLSVDMPSGRGTVPIPPPPQIVSSTTAFATNPGAWLGLEYADVQITPNLTPHTVTLQSVDAAYNSILVASYWSGKDGVVTRPGEPALPLEVYDASVDNMVLRGIGLQAGCFVDLQGTIPLNGAATTEVRGVHPPFWSDVFFPIRTWNANYFDVLSNPTSGLTRMVVTPAQFKSDGLDSYTGTMRNFNDMNFRLYYSSETGDYNGNVPALAAPPAIAKVVATEETGVVKFQVSVVGDPSAGIQEVWVTHTPGTPSGDDPACGGNFWQKLPLIQNMEDSTLWEWEGALNLPTGTSLADVRYMVQAVNGVGLVSLNSNLGNYFTIGIDPGNPPATGTPTTLNFISPTDTEGAYSTLATFTVQGLDNQGQVNDGQPIIFMLGTQKRIALTNGGIATVKFPLLAPPGNYNVRASFVGNPTYQGSAGFTPFTIYKQPTSLTVTTFTPNIDDQATAIFFADLTDSQDRPLPDKTIFIFVKDESGVVVRAASGKTNLFGRAFLPVGGLPVGTYSVNTYFGVKISLPIPPELTSQDPNYEYSTAEVSFCVLESGEAISTSAIDPITVGTFVPATATFSFDSNLDKEPSKAIWYWGDGSKSESYNVDIEEHTASVIGNHVYETPGVYIIRIVVYYNANTDQSPIWLPFWAAEYRFVTVYDPTSGFATGGGWFDSPAGAYAPDLSLTGKAAFGFVSKYNKDEHTPSGNTQFQFKAGDLKFRSDSYEWMNITNAKVMYTGVGTINGSGNFGFRLIAIDANLNDQDIFTVDRFRIIIWDKDNGDTIVYDNQVVGDKANEANPTTEIGGGSITIHKK